MTEQTSQVFVYRSFLLRCWQGRGRYTGSQGSWRYSLEDPVTGQKRGFTDLQALLAFIELELDRERQIKLSGTNAYGF